MRENLFERFPGDGRFPGEPRYIVVDRKYFLGSLTFNIIYIYYLPFQRSTVMRKHNQPLKDVVPAHDKTPDESRQIIVEPSRDKIHEGQFTKSVYDVCEDRA